MNLCGVQGVESRRAAVAVEGVFLFGSKGGFVFGAMGDLTPAPGSALSKLGPWETPVGPTNRPKSLIHATGIGCANQISTLANTLMVRPPSHRLPEVARGSQAGHRTSRR